MKSYCYKITKISVLACVVGFVFCLQLHAQQSSYNYDKPGNLTAVIGTNAVAPSITTQPQSALLYSNNPVSLSVVANGAGISYQWLSNGVPILGATNDTLIFPSLTSTNGNFSVIISNASGSITSSPAAIWLDSRGVGMPDWWQMQYFGNLNQSPYGDYDGDGVDNLDEYLEGTNPTNAASFDPRLYIQTPSNGRMVASPDLPYYTMGQVVTLTAIPDNGQDFLGWSGAATGTKTSIALVMSTNETVSASFGIPLQVALDNPNLVWTTGGNAPWYGQTAVTEDGTNAAQSGLISNSQQTWLQTIVTNLNVPAQLGFWWNVSSQPPDGMTFSLDGTVIGSISGTALGWQYVQTNLTVGIHTLLWTYSKGSGDIPTGIPFADSAWLDEVSITPLPTPPSISSQPQSQTNYFGTSAQFSVVANGSLPLIYQWRLNSNSIPAATNSSLLLANVSHTNVGIYAVLVTNLYGSKLSSNAVLNVLVPQQLSGAKLTSGVFTLTAGYADGWPVGSGELTNFAAQVSSNLLSWTTLSNSLTLSNGFLLLQDPSVTNQPTRFYRIIQY
jgi:List-Bact-rpt repeat protein